MRTPLDKDGLQTLLSVKVQQKHVDKWLKMPKLRRERKHATQNPIALAINAELDKQYHCYIDYVSIIIVRTEFSFVEYTHATPIDIGGLITYMPRHEKLEFLVGMLISFPIPTSLLKTRSKKPCSQPPTPTSS